MSSTHGIAYSLRFDNEHTCTLNEDYSKFFQKFLKDNFTKYLFALENKKDNTPHFQGICWSKEKLDKKTFNRLRAQIRLKLVGPSYQGKGSYAFTIAKKPASLAKYCNNKELKGIVTNLTVEERDEIGEWVDKELQKKTRKHIWLNLMEEINDPQTTAGAVALVQTRAEWTHSIIGLYQGIYGSLPRNTQVENWVYNYKSTPQERTHIRSQKYANIFAGLYDCAYQEYDPTE